MRWRIARAVYACLGLAALAHAHPCVLEGFDLRGIPPLTFTLPLEHSDEAYQWVVGFCNTVPPPTGASCDLPGSPGYLQQLNTTACLRAFPLLASVQHLPNGVRLVLQQSTVASDGDTTVANIRIGCSPSTTGEAAVAMSAVRVVEDLGDYVLTFKHACACRGACLIPDGVESSPTPATMISKPPNPSPASSSSSSGDDFLDDLFSDAPLPLPTSTVVPSPDVSQSPSVDLAPDASPVDLCRAVACPAPDQCHIAGVCDLRTGACSTPTAPDGTPCSDGNLKTYFDECKDGQCRGHSPFCFGNPCRNGGRCDDEAEVCNCPVPWGGPTCEDEVRDPCDPNPCANGGICSSVGTQMKCVCPASFEGPRCKTPTSTPPETSPTDSHASSPGDPAGPPSKRHPWLAVLLIAFLLLALAAIAASPLTTARRYCFKPAHYHPMPTDVEMDDVDVNPFAQQP